MQKLNSNRLGVGSRFPSRKYSTGFSLFELVVFIISVAIIYAAAANRFSKFPEAAERANFLAVTAQIQAGVSLETTLGVASNGYQNMSRFEGANPIDMLLSPPANYLGAMDSIAQSELPRRSWYFDLRNSELVYLVNASENVFLEINGVQIPSDEIRFEIAVKYHYRHRKTGVVTADLEENDGEDYSPEDYHRRFSGVLIQPVTPYRWFSSEAELLDATNGNEPS